MEDECILIVEDDAIAQLTLAQYLKDLGFPHSLAVNNGKDAIEAVKNKAVMLAFLDVRIMGEWDGVDTAQQIQKNQPDLPLVFLTANTDRGTMKRVQATHPYAVVRKPYDRKMLSEVIGGALNHSVDASPYSEEKTSLPSHILEPAAVGVSVTDVSGTIISVNAEFCHIHRCTEAEAVGQLFTRYFPENIQSFALNLHREFMAGRTTEGGGAWTVIDQHGSPREVDIKVHKVALEGSDAFKISTFTNISRQRKNAERLRKILEEKDAFAREIHHRVKNNLNVISGLFYLQSEQVRDRPEVYNLFQESVSRVKAMAIIHEQLYDYENYTTIDLSKYVPLLAEAIRDTFIDSDCEVALDIEVASVPLDVDRAVACGLIINEVMSNSFKYAFDAPTQPPQISVKGFADEQRVTLVMQDNGVGLPPDFDADQVNTLGVQLIKTLTRQLDGQLSMQRNSPTGTHVSLSFPA